MAISKVGQLRKRRAIKQRASKKVDLVALAMLVCGPLHGLIMSYVFKWTTASSVISELGMPKRVVDVVLESLVQNKLVVATRIDQSLIVYSTAQLSACAVSCVLGPKVSSIFTYE